jgi:hypothetical protein
MQTPLAVQQIDEKILRLKQQLLALGPFHPGSLSRQYQVCGKPGCKCCDPKKPRPHGPYTKLTYVHRGKFTCRFVRADSLQEVTALVAAFKTFRQLTEDWVALATQRAQLGPFQRTVRVSKSTPRGKEPQKSPKQSKKGR